MALTGGKQPTILRCVEYEILSLECKSSLGRPPPSITWLIGNSYSNASAVTTTENNPVSYNASDETYNYTQDYLALTVNRTFNNKRIFCNSTNLPDVDSVSSNYFTFDVYCKYSVTRLTPNKCSNYKDYIIKFLLIEIKLSTFIYQKRNFDLFICNCPIFSCAFYGI